MAGAVGGELLAQLHLLAEQGELAVVADVAAVRQFEVVLFKDVENDGQQDDGVALVSLLTVVIHKPVSLYLPSLGKVDVEQVDIRQPCVAGDEEAVFHLLTFLALRLVGNEAVELFARQEHALLAPALHDVQAVVGVRCDDLPHDGLPDDCLDGVVDFCDGGVGHQV